ncbi:hypothetical protein [Paraburkholderia sp. J11-2]|uniref:hypothetical protein n=1 Tax=Paraburkholderia sp. J11-2 TaxID=2805431 RepID=UPI002AB6812B|nr:hypothetical protein [Paraburkholderia sp. J11-2]
MKDAPAPTGLHAYGERLTPVMRHPQLDRSYWGVAHVFHRSGSKRRNAGCNHELSQAHPCPGADKGLRDPSNAPAASNAA